MSSERRVKGWLVERRIPDEALKQFHVKSTDIQISTMICQVSGEITGAGIAEFHTPAPSPLLASLLSAITGRRLAVGGDGEHLCKSEWLNTLNR